MPGCSKGRPTRRWTQDIKDCLYMTAAEAGHLFVVSSQFWNNRKSLRISAIRGESGSEKFVQKVVNALLLSHLAMADKEKAKNQSAVRRKDGQTVWSTDTASKHALSGHKKKTIHKEELLKSEKDQGRKNIPSNAPKMQQKTVEVSAHKSHQTIPQVGKTTATSLPSTSAITQQSPMHISETSQHSSEKKVRLQTSDGRQVILTVDKDVTYTELQKLIYEAVGVPDERQKIRVGSPPRLLDLEDLKEQIVPLHHGDKIVLEILQNVKSKKMEEESEHAKDGRRQSWSSFDEDVSDQSAEKLLEALKEAHHGGDSVDTSIASLSILSALSGKDFWIYVQGMPHLFSVGGLLYNQVKRDLGLVDGKHCQLPCLPGKVFCYNAQEDRLELCLEPLGHFSVEPHIEQKIKDMGIEGTQMEDASGTNGATGHNQGQGHILTALDIRMPGDLEYVGHRPHVRGIHDLCRGHSESISEEPDETRLEESEAVNQTYQRLGPGYSVLDETSCSNENNTSLEMFKAFTQHIEKIWSGDEIEEDKDVISISSATDSVFPDITPIADASLAKLMGDLNIDNNTAKKQ